MASLAVNARRDVCRATEMSFDDLATIGAIRNQPEVELIADVMTALEDMEPEGHARAGYVR